MFDPHFLQHIRGFLATDLLSRLDALELDYQAAENDAELRLELKIRKNAVATILLESYLIQPDIVIASQKDLAEEYARQGYFLQSYQHSVEALNKFKVYHHQIQNQQLCDQLYVNLCETCFANGSFREALYYVQEFYKRSGQERDGQGKEDIGFQLRIVFVHAKTLYKIGDFRESERVLNKCLETLERRKSEPKETGDTVAEEPSVVGHFLTLQVEALNHLQKIARKEGNFVQMATFLRQILRVCSTAEKGQIGREKLFYLKVKFSLLQLDYLDAANPDFHPVPKAFNRQVKATHEFLENFHLLVNDLQDTIERELYLLGKLRGKSTLQKLRRLLESQTQYFYHQNLLLEMQSVVGLLAGINRYFGEPESNRSCAYQLTNELLRIRLASDWSGEWREQTQSELRGVQKSARILKNKFLKDITKGLAMELDCLEGRPETSDEWGGLLEGCENKLKLLMEKIEQDFQ
jgi:hypothetical protein